MDRQRQTRRKSLRRTHRLYANGIGFSSVLYYAMEKGLSYKDTTMPRISAFFGMTIWMYYNDHQPPHFHVHYGDDEALIVIGSGDLYEGYLSRRALRLVQEWEELHRAELFANWELARQKQLLIPIAPLT